MKHIILSTGGTGGHVFPALSLAAELKKRGHKVDLITDQRGSQYQDSSQFDQVKILSIPKAVGLIGKIKQLVSVVFHGLRLAVDFYKTKPDAVVGFGGYTSAPVVLGAWLSGVPIYIHEQNAVLGRVNRLMARVAKGIAIGMPITKGAPDSAVFVGNPVRDVFLSPPESIPNNSCVNLFVFGGSQGADLFGRIVPKAVALLPTEIQQRIHIVHQARSEIVDNVHQAYAETDCQVDLLQPFFPDMPQRISGADIIICRAGAMTVTEIAIVGRAAIFVPLKIAMDNHQYWNVQPMVDAGVAEMIEEKALTSESLASVLHRLIQDSECRHQYAMRIRQFAVSDAAVKLADFVVGDSHLSH
ncbi:MAG: undecaprenyldiphospho-muramoylpentapeptide beta-N-acetylglucosaminyltransferase [Candidatus Paracaedibacteraceae bacterium]|nr:undecaprenyldiphospho-muramoylpentapeptide beta-N-acetylglucosaminyltransferase [Candidatus Paracaedibacteraceae bacterium]